jgi:hypothetical protein
MLESGNESGLFWRSVRDGKIVVVNGENLILGALIPLASIDMDWDFVFSR